MTKEELWCAARREQVAEYLATEAARHGTRFGQIGEWPAWHVIPHVSVWVVESVRAPGSVGWWVICGDLPTDYIGSAGIDNPRNAVESIARRWLEFSPFLRSGAAHPDMHIGSGAANPELAHLLENRAHLLLGWTEEDSVWPSR